MIGLSIGDVVNVGVSLSPAAAAARNLSNLLILGSSANIIDTTERMRQYSSLAAVAADFGTSAPEYLAAQLYYQQAPQPANLYVGTFAQVATVGRLLGAPLTTAQQSLSIFTALVAGSLKLNIDGVDHQITGINLSGAANLNAVATLVSTAFAGLASCVWNATALRFEIYSLTTGATSAISFSETVSSGTDISAAMRLRTGTGGRTAVGSAVETPLAGAIACAAFSNDWYALMFAPVSLLADADRIAVAGFIEAAQPVRIYGITTSSVLVPDPTQTTDIASALQALGYQRTLIQYSTSTPYAVASLLGRALTVDFTGNNTAITLKFKNEPGVLAETLTETQASTLTAKNCNVFVNYNNSTAIVQQGCMVGGNFIDETQGMDWLQNALQTAVYNLLYLSATKIPQTDAGVNQIVATCATVLAQAVNNGLIAPGAWTAAGFGALVQGQMLAKGYYIYATPVSQQLAADRAARKAPTLQIAAKLAGAVHSANVLVTMNR